MTIRQKPVEMPKAACIALIAIAWAVAIINVVINIRNGQKLSLDDAGWLLNGAIVGALSLAPVALTSAAGYLYSSKRLGWAVFATIIAIPLVAFNLWNANEFVGDQMIGRFEEQQNKTESAKELAEKQNAEALRSKRDLEDRLSKAFIDAKDPSEKARIAKELEKVRNTPLALTAPSFERSTVGARTGWLSRMIGWDKDTIAGITPAAVPILMQVVELCLSLLGFGTWPRRDPQEIDRNGLDSPNSAGFGSDINERKAKSDLTMLIVTGQLPKGKNGLGNCDFARRWGVSESTSHAWLEKFESENLIQREQRGRRKIVIPAEPPKTHPIATHLNGKASAVAGTA